MILIFFVAWLKWFHFIYSRSSLFPQIHIFFLMGQKNTHQICSRDSLSKGKGCRNWGRTSRIPILSAMFYFLYLKGGGASKYIMGNCCPSWWWEKMVGEEETGRRSQPFPFFIWQGSGPIYKDPLPTLPPALWRKRNLLSPSHWFPTSFAGTFLAETVGKQKAEDRAELRNLWT